MTSFEDSHYILLFRYIYGAQLIQWFCYSKHLHVNRNYRPNGTATSLSPKCYSANVPLDFCTTADFDMKYFLTKAPLAFWVIPNWFSRVCSQNGYLNSKLMLRWDGHFNFGLHPKKAGVLHQQCELWSEVGAATKFLKPLPLLPLPWLTETATATSATFSKFRNRYAVLRYSATARMFLRNKKSLSPSFSEFQNSRNIILTIPGPA